MEIDSKFPIGMCQQIIGSLGNIESDYEYILFNHGLNYKKHNYIGNIENVDQLFSRIRQIIKIIVNIRH